MKDGIQCLREVEAPLSGKGQSGALFGVRRRKRSW